MSIPQFPSAIPRPHIVQRLNTLFEFRTALVSAPPGYGKTAAVAQFANETTYPVVWHSLTSEERDLSFLLICALAAVQSAKDMPVDSQVPEHLSPADVVSLLTTRLATIFEDQPFIYILDNLEYLIGAPASEEWLRAFIDLLPKQARLVLITQQLPKLPFVEMVARGEILAVGQQDLRFQANEIAALREQYQHIDTDDDFDNLEGWPAGIILKLQPLPEGLGQVIGEDISNPELLFTVLAEQMLNSQLPDFQHFLLSASVLIEITPELCLRVLEIENGLEWITLAQRQNLFLSRQGSRFVFHTLFRDFLQKKLNQTNPRRYKNLHTKAAEWHFQNNLIDQSFYHYLASGQLDQAVAVTENSALSLFQSGRLETLLDWYGRLQELNQAGPQLALTCGMIYTDRFDIVNAKKALDTARDNMEPDMDSYIWTQVQLQTAQVYQREGRYQDVISTAEEFIEHHDPGVRGRAKRMQGLAHIRLGRIEEALNYYKLALPLYRQHGDEQALSQILQDMHFVLSRLGDLQEAGEYLQEVVAIRRKMGSKSALAIALNNLGTQYHDTSDYRSAEKVLREGLDLITEINHLWPELYLCWSLGNLYRDLGSFERANHFYQRAFKISYEIDDPAVRCGLLINLSIMRRWQGLYDQALFTASEAVGFSEENQLPLENVRALICKYGAISEMSDPQHALEQLRALEDKLEAQQAPFEFLHYKMLCTQILLRLGNEMDAYLSYQEAVSSAENIGSAQRIAVMTVHTPILEDWVERSGMLSALAAHDLNALKELWQVNYTQDFSEYTHETFTVRVYCLDDQRVECDGVPIPLSDWKSAAARELFFFLLFRGATSREDISLNFWPDSDEKQGRDLFHTTLYRARQALGESVIVYEKPLYKINPEVDIWCDALEFQSLIAEARRLPFRDARAEDQWYHALALYKGPFLRSVDQEWANLLREKLDTLHADALQGYGRCALARKDYHLAETYFQKAVTQDPYREDLRRDMLQLLFRRGAVKQLIDYYEETEAFFLNELGFGFSAETRTFFKNLQT